MPQSKLMSARTIIICFLIYFIIKIMRIIWIYIIFYYIFIRLFFFISTYNLLKISDILILFCKFASLEAWQYSPSLCHIHTRYGTQRDKVRFSYIFITIQIYITLSIHFDQIVPLTFTKTYDEHLSVTISINIIKNIKITLFFFLFWHCVTNSQSKQKKKIEKFVQS